MKTLRIVTIMMVCFACLAGAGQIFYESFEGPVVGSAADGTDPTGWTDTSPVGNRAGLGYLVGSSYANYYGNQAAWLNVYNGTPQLETTTAILNETLTPEIRYMLTFNTASSAGSYFGYYTAYADLLAGTNVVMTASITPNDSKNFALYVASNAVLPKAGDPGVGETMAIRLRVSGGYWNADCYIDNLRLNTEDTSTDTNPPTPDPMTWVQGPTPCGSNGVVMSCSVASDDNWVEYFFTNTLNGKTSGWIDETTWRETGLGDGGTYSYKVKARDKSANWNETDWSTEKNAIVSKNVLLYDSFEFPVVSGATTGTDPSDWEDVSPSGGSCGMGKVYGTSYSGYRGHQAAWLNVYGTEPVLITTSNILNTFLQADKEPYILTFNAASSSSYTLHADLLAGSNVVLTASTTSSSQDFSSHFATNSYLPAEDDPGVGEMLRVRLRVTGGSWNSQSYIDNLQLTGPPPPGPPGMVIFLK